LKKNAGIRRVKGLILVAELQPPHEMIAKLFTVKILLRKIHHRDTEKTIQFMSYKSFIFSVFSVSLW
jgi:hypothetical protein